MNRTIRKIVSRGLLRAPGRFISVFLIIVLGAGFLAGLQSAGPGMASTANNYFSEKSLADFWLYCDEGISAEDVEAVQALPEVAEALGGYRVDLLASANSEVSLFSILSLPHRATKDTTDYLSQLDLVEGRLPTSDTEGVADPSSDLQVGDTVTVSENNREDTLSLLSRKSFTVVGLAWSPRYISTERGSTSVGNGRVSQYLFVSEAAFSGDWYTELVIRLTTTEGHSAFSSGYTQAVKDATQKLQDLTRTRAGQRFDGILKEATKKLNEGEASLKSKNTEAANKLKAAKKKLDDGESDLRVAQQEYTKQERRLADSKSQLNRAKSDLKAKSTELNAQSGTVDEARRQLDKAKTAHTTAQGRLTDLQAALAAAVDPAERANLRAQITGVETQIATLEEQIASGETELAAGQKALAAAKGAYAAAEAQIKDGDRQLAEGTSALAEAARKINRSKDTLNSGTADYKRQVASANEKSDAARAELDAGWRKVGTLEQPEWSVQGRDDLPGYSGFRSNMDRINGLSLILPWFFFLVAAIVCLTTMTRMVEEHRGQIGTLKANGYRRWQIMAIYQSYAWLIGLAGGAAGVGFGLMVFPPAIWNAYSTQYHMGAFEAIITLAPCAIGLLGGAVALSLATAAACRNSLNKNAAELMRPRSPRMGKRVAVERLGFLWRRLSFSHKATVRNLFRYKARFAVTIVGVAGCTALLVAGFGLRDSISGIVDLQYGQISRAQATLVLEDPSSVADDTELNGLLTRNKTLFSYAHSENIVVTHDGRTNANITTYLLVPEDPESYASLMNFRQPGDRKPIVFPLDEPEMPTVVMTAQVATALAVRVGDLVSFDASGAQAAQVRVGAIMENYVYNYLYLAPASYRSLVGRPAAFNTVVMSSDLQGDQLDTLLGDLVSADNVATALRVSELKTIVDQVITNLSAVIWLMVFAALALAVIVIYNLITINVTERERELATLKVLGYHRNEVAGYISRESFIMACFGILPGLLGGLLLHASVMSVFVSSDIMFPQVVKPLSFVFAAAVPLLCTALVNLCIRPRLNRLDPAKSLKSVE